MDQDVWRIVAEEAMDVVRAHVLSSPEVEVGGFLVGRHDADDGGPLAVGAIEAASARGDLTRLTFTHDAWEHAHQVQEERWPDTTIVGWYHSHPGHGIFLSAHDRFIHRNFFSAPWQIAIVVDPQRRTEGLFAWVDGDVACLHQRPLAEGGPPSAAPLPAVAAPPVYAAPSVPRRYVVELADEREPAPVLEPERLAPAVALNERPTVTVPVEPPRAPAHPERPRPVRPRRRSHRPYAAAAHFVPVAAGLAGGVALRLLA